MGDTKVIQGTRLDTITVGNLRTIIGKLEEKKSKTSDNGTIKTINNLINKYNKQINKTALLYRSNKDKSKHRENFKGTRLAQLSYKKVLEIINKDKKFEFESQGDGLGSKINAEISQHPVETVIAAAGVTTTLVGVIGEGVKQKDKIAVVINAIKSFIDTQPWLSCMITGTAVVAGVIAWKAIRNKRAESAYLKEEAESEVTGTNEHDEKVEGATLDGQQEAIATDAYKDPELREHLQEIASNVHGHYTPVQMSNAQKILAKVTGMENKVAVQSLGNVIQNTIVNDEELGKAFEDYNRSKNNPLTDKVKEYEEQFGEAAKLSEEQKARLADTRTLDLDSTEASGLDSKVIDNINNFVNDMKSTHSDFKNFFNKDGSVNEIALLDYINKDVASDDKKLNQATHSTVFAKLKSLLNDRGSKIIFDKKKAKFEAENPNVQKYITAKDTLSEPEKMDYKTKAISSPEFAAVSGTYPDKSQIHIVINNNKNKVIQNATENIELFATASDLDQAIIDGLTVGLKTTHDDYSNIIVPALKNHDIFKTVKDRVQQLIDKSNAKETLNEMGGDPVAAADTLYNKLIDKICSNDPKQNKADLQAKYPTMEALEAKFGDNFKNAEHMLEDAGLSK